MASFYLRQVHLKSGNINYAENAFEEAARFDYDLGVKEEAFFALAKLKYDSKLRAQSIGLLQKYIDSYPKGKYIKQANEYLSEAFLTSNDYNAAIKFIESLEKKSPLITETYQKVTFYKAVEQFNDRNFKGAIQNFNKSTRVGIRF